MSKTRQQRTPRKHKKTMKRFKGGRKPTARRLTIECRILKELYTYFMETNDNADFTRLYNKSDDKLYECLDKLQRLSPYAYLPSFEYTRKSLLLVVTDFVTLRDMFPRRIFTDIIKKTIAEQDVEIMNENIVCGCLALLLFARKRNFDISEVFKDDIRLLLTAIPPADIGTDCWRWGVYGGVTRRFDFNTLESLILGGHIPNTQADYKLLLDNLEERLRVRENWVEYKSEYPQEKVDEFVELFKVLKPRNIYNTTNMIYMLQNTGTPLNADNVEELHSYLPVEEEVVVAEEAADDGDEEDNGDY